MTVNGPEYRTTWMLPSPRGRELRRIEGNASDIARRGRDMKDLGDRMQMAANALNQIANGNVGKGLSIDKLRDAAEDVYSDLKKAGVRYSPSGEVLADYGDALESVQSPINTLVTDGASSWQIVRWRSIALEEATQAGDDTAELQLSFDRAVSAWREDVRGYDGYYDTWNSAYNAARSGLKDANDNGVKDSWLDNALPALEIIGWVLTAVGVVLAVVACIIGAPFLLIAAAIAGIASLIVTIALYAGGRADGNDIFWAAFGVFPFGKAFSAFRGLSKVSSVFGDLIGLGSKATRGAVQGLLSRGGVAEVFHRGGTLNKHGSRVLRDWFGGTGGPSVLHRLLQGFDGATGAHFSNAAAGLSNKARGNLFQFLNGSNGSPGIAGLIDDAPGAIDKVLNFVDNPVKTVTGIADQFGWI